MKSKPLSKGIRKFIREEKGRIRKENISTEEQEKKVSDLVDKFKTSTEA